MSHGFPHDRKEEGRFKEIAEKLNQVGFNVLAFDFSGSGESDKTPITIQKEVEDVDAAIEFCKDRGAKKLGLYGYSLGGLVTLKNYSSEIDAIVLTSLVTDSIDLSEKRIWSFFANLIGKVPSIYHLINKRKLVWIDSKIIEEGKNIDQDEILDDVDCPVRIIHAEEDQAVDLKVSKKAVRKLENADLQTIPDTGHDYYGKWDRVVDLTVEWFKEYM